jgi:O-acetyl-ADP-ribose deacetylase (regulator of RNase III)
MASIDVWHGSIGDADVDVLVNASNTLLQLGSGVSAAIRQTCGGATYQSALDERLQREFGGGLEPGAVVITDAGSHPRAKYVAHVAVMDYRPGPGIVSRPDAARIERGAAELWTKLAALPHPVSVGMVALGAGTGGLGLRDSVRIACTTLKAQLETDPGRICAVQFVAYDELEFANTIDTVRQHFELDLGKLDEHTRRLVEAVQS